MHSAHVTGSLQRKTAKATAQRADADLAGDEEDLYAFRFDGKPLFTVGD